MEQQAQHPEGLVKRAVYKGAGVMADIAKTAVDAIPVDENYGTEQKPRSGITSEEKASLVLGFGISRMDVRDGQVQVSIGFHGRNANGLKNSTVMRRVESGTSYMRKTPTIRPAANRGKAAAISAMREQFERDVKETYNF